MKGVHLPSVGSGRRPFGAEPATQSQAKPLVPNAGGSLIELPFPHKALWPNGRAHHFTVSRERRKHKQWAHDATLAAHPRLIPLEEGSRLRLVATFHPKTRHPIDKDNASAALKAYQDGIAAALRVNDRIFEEPEIHFAEPGKPGKVLVRVEAA